MALVFCFALFALLYFASRWKGAFPYVFLNGDAANIASFAAGWDHGNLFAGDEVLGNPDNFRFYATIHVPLVRMLASLTGDYGSAFVLLLGPHIFLQALGFYIFGRVVFQNRYWAMLLALMTLMTVYLNLGEYWGVFLDVQPRFTFQAFLPYLMAAFFYWRAQPQAWFWLMAGAGTMIYLHPVSAPGWGLAFWLGLWLFLPESFSRWQRWRQMLIAAAGFFIVALPWVIFYISHHAHGGAVNYQQLQALMQKGFSPGYLSVPLATQEFAGILWHQRSARWLVAVSLCSFFWMDYEIHRKGAVKKNFDFQAGALIRCWILGIVIASIVISFMEQKIEQTYQLLPVQIDLIRGIRYLIPLLIIYGLWALREIHRHGKPQVQKMALAFATLLALGWLYDTRNFVGAIVKPGVICWTQGHFACMPDDWKDQQSAFAAIRQQTSSHARFFPVGKKAQAYALAIRYNALRPLVYAHRDFGALAYANHAALLKWAPLHQEMLAIEAQKNNAQKISGIKQFSTKVKADYCLIDTDSALNAAWLAHSKSQSLLYSGPVFSVWKMQRDAR